MIANDPSQWHRPQSAMPAWWRDDLDAARLAQMSHVLRGLLDIDAADQVTILTWRMILKTIFPGRIDLVSGGNVRALAQSTGETIGRVLNAGTQADDGMGEAVLPVLRQMCDAIDTAVAKAQKKPGPAP